MKKHLSVYDFKQSPFYNLKTKKKLAAILKVPLEDLDDLQRLAMKYRRAWLHKKDKKRWLNIEPNIEQASYYRQIDLPIDKLKRVQKRFEMHLSRIRIADNVFSPAKGRSYVNNAAEHRGAKSIYTMDIDNYFPNTVRSKVIYFFRNFMLCSVDVSVIIANIVMKGNGLPQGSPCSPILAYLANQRMWSEITQEVQKFGCKSTIYADDLTISGDVVPLKLVHNVRQIITKHGMSVKKEKNKSSYLRASKITGIIVKGEQLLLPNGKHLKIKEAGLEVRKAEGEIEKQAALNRLRSRQAQKSQIENSNL